MAVRTRLLVLLAAVAAAVACVVPGAAAHSSNVVGSVASPAVPPGASFTLVLDSPGAYAYMCHPHPWMTGRLEVEPGTSPTGPVAHVIEMVDDGSPSGEGAHFRDATTGGTVTTLHTGDIVVWTNTGNLTHDVHLTPAPVTADNGAFEATVLVGLAVTLAGIFLLSRRA